MVFFQICCIYCRPFSYEDIQSLMIVVSFVQAGISEAQEVTLATLYNEYNKEVSVSKKLLKVENVPAGLDEMALACVGLFTLGAVNLKQMYESKVYIESHFDILRKSYFIIKASCDPVFRAVAPYHKPEFVTLPKDVFGVLIGVRNGTFVFLLVGEMITWQPS